LSRLPAAVSAACLLAILPVALAQEATEAPPKPASNVTWQVRAIVSGLAPTAGPETSKAEFWYGSFAASFVRDGFGARAEGRGTPGGFRPYYGTDIWLEEGYAFATTVIGDVRVGKMERAFGLADETFEGNLFSLNGVTRAPDWGAGLVGEARVGYNSLSWALRWIGQGDQNSSWEEDGRGAASEPDTKLKDGVEGRAAFLFYKGLVTLKPGLSVSSVQVARGAGQPGFRMTDLAGDLTLTLGPIAILGELLWRSGDPAIALASGRLAYDDGFAGLAGFRAELPTVGFRYVFTGWHYRGADDTESLHQPAVVWTPRKGIEATIEYRVRHRPRSEGGGVENAFRLGLALTF